MMIFSLCNSCFQPFKLNLQPGDVHLVRQIADEDMNTCPCPRLCGGRINLTEMPVVSESSKILKQSMSITGRELYVAVNGAGLPDEIVTDPVVVEALMKANSVKEVFMEKHGERVYLHQISLSNGVTLHLTAGSRGAQVLKITKDRE